MQAVTIALDERLLSRSEAYAQERGLTLSSLVGSLLETAVAVPPKPVVDRLFAAMDRAEARSSGERWSREEIYRRSL